MFEFSHCLDRLGCVQIHLISIEISIVRRAYRKVESEGIVGKYANSMSHHAHFVKSGLTIEKNIISILQLSLDCGAVGEVFGYVFIFDVVEVDEVGMTFSYLRLTDEFYFSLFA